jgi:hypothetical protein
MAAVASPRNTEELEVKRIRDSHREEMTKLVPFVVKALNDLIAVNNLDPPHGNPKPANSPPVDDCSHRGKGCHGASARKRSWGIQRGIGRVASKLLFATQLELTLPSRRASWKRMWSIVSTKGMGIPSFS